MERKSKDDVKKAVAELQSQLEGMRKSLESAWSRLTETNRELEEVNKKCGELEETVSSKDKEIGSLKCELKGEELLRKEVADENLQLKLELEKLKRK